MRSLVFVWHWVIGQLNHSQPQYRIRPVRSAIQSPGEHDLIDGTAISEEECRRFLDQWKALAGAEVMPHTSDFLHDPDPALISFAHIMEITDRGQLVRFMGTGLVDLWGEDRTNQIFGTALPKEVKGELDRRSKTLATHPCGLIEVSEFSSPTGRPFEMETVVLPLSVDSGKPLRYCSFSKVIEPLERDEGYEARYKSTHHQTWIDIGNGVPTVGPQIM